MWEVLKKYRKSDIINVGDVMKRKIYSELLDWKNNSNFKPLMVLGVRQCGKTYILDKFCREEFENYIYINLFEQDNIIDLYNSSLTSDEKYARLKVLVDFDLDKENTVLFIDEIQESEKLISELKYFCERHNSLRIVCAGSLLGIKLKRSKSAFPVGKIKMINLYPMDFEEFLISMNQEMLVDLIRKCYENNQQISGVIHEKALKYYTTYLITGGMPESVANMVQTNGDYIKYDRTILKDILNSYFEDMNRYVNSHAESLKIERLYKSLPSQLSNLSNKFQYSNIEKGGRARDYATSLDWLEANNMVLKSSCVKTPQIPLEGFVDMDTFKLYLSDVGILNNILNISIEDILTDNISLYKGVIAENYVANQLVSNGNKLYYWKNDNTSKIDFLLYTRDGIIPIEVKAGNSTQSKSLKYYIDKYNPPYSIRISTKEFGYDPKTKVKSIPLYATFLIK